MEKGIKKEGLEMEEKEIREIIYGIATDAIGEPYENAERSRRKEYKKVAVKKFRDAGITEDSIISNADDSKHIKGQIRRWMEKY